MLKWQAPEQSATIATQEADSTAQAAQAQAERQMMLQMQHEEQLAKEVRVSCIRVPWQLDLIAHNLER